MSEGSSGQVLMVTLYFVTTTITVALIAVSYKKPHLETQLI
jgi:hypothetical protein